MVNAQSARGFSSSGSKKDYGDEGARYERWVVVVAPGVLSTG